MDSRSSSAAPGSHRGVAVQLLDVLEQLPTPQLRESLWPYLSHTDRTSCRLTSQRLLRLAEQMQSEFTIDFRARDASHEDVFRHGLCMARHEHLEALSLKLPSDERRAVQCLTLGGLAGRRVCTACVEGATASGATTAVTGDALALACPALRKLSVEFTVVDPTFFEALGVLMHLEEVKTDDCPISPAVMRSLASLRALRTLELRDFRSTRHVVTAGTMPHLVTLSGLRSLCLTGRNYGGADMLRLLCGLGALTRLTHLAVGSSSSVGGVRRDATCEAAFNAMLAQLGSLQGLVSLRLFDMASSVDGTGLWGLHRLTALTYLKVDRLLGGSTPSAAADAGGGHLPQLRELHLACPVDGVELLAALCPLLPLHHLADLRVSVRLSSAQRANNGGLAGLSLGDGDPPAVAAACMEALHRAVTHLVAAPELQRVHLTLIGSRGSTDADVLGDTLAVLKALPAQLGRLSLTDFSAAQMSGLTAALARCPHLDTLQLVDCSLDTAAVLHLAQHNRTLRELHVGRQPPGGVTPSMLASLFVAARMRPLTLSWAGLQAPADMAAMQVALRMLGKAALVRVVPCPEW